MSGIQRPINLEQAIGNVLALIEERGDGPCPTLREIMQVTGVARRNVWDFMDGLKRRGLIGLETRGKPPACFRRVRLPKGPWTRWTVRRWARRHRGHA